MRDDSRVGDPRRLAAAAGADPQFASDVDYYLSLDPRQLPSRYLYDALGSALFEAICALPWYAITRAETALLAAHGAEIAAAAPCATLVELGPGSGQKMLTLIEAGALDETPLEIHLIDVSARALDDASDTLAALAHARVVAHQAEYETGLLEAMRLRRRAGRTLTLFLGSNIGNFDPPGADEFLRTIRGAIGAGNSLLLGTDLVKPADALVRAYDDPLGVTAAFNRNLLVRITRELDGDFDLDAFGHRAVWNAADSRVEMHLVCRRRQTVHVGATGLVFTIEAGETIWTESSYKYEPAAVVAMLSRAGFARRRQWVDEARGFAVTLVEAI
jgi:dimethylhistidine N-methyltransferase